MLNKLMHFDILLLLYSTIYIGYQTFNYRHWFFEFD